MNILKKIGSYIIAFFVGVVTLAAVFFGVQIGDKKQPDATNDIEDQKREDSINEIKNIKY